MSEINLLCDTSGSMAEGGKRYILRNQIRAIDQYYRLLGKNVDIKLILWSNNPAVIDWGRGQDVPDGILDCNGRSDMSALIKAIGSDNEGYFAVLSDCFWDSNTRKELSEWSRALRPNHFRIIKIGEDANPSIKGPNVYEGSELIAALEDWVD